MHVYRLMNPVYFLRRERDFLNSNEVESLKALMKDVKYKTEHSVFHTRRAVDTLVLESVRLKSPCFTEGRVSIVMR